MSKKHRGRFKGDPVTYQLPNPAGGVQLETFVPWTLVKRGLRKQVITPLDAPQEFLSEATREREARSAAQDTALMRALGLAHHWQRLLDEQRAASVAEIAEVEGMDVTQVRRVMRLTLLAPEVVERLVGSPDAVLETAQRFQGLEKALARLPPEHREILLLREIEEMSYEDIAAVLNLNTGTVKSRIARARAGLLEKMPH